MPAALPASRPGGLTIKSSGWFFVLSGVFSLVWVTSDVAFLGAVRSGAFAFVYNFVFAALFLAMGVGLIVGRWWGYRVFMGGTAFYSLDRILFFVSKDTREAYLAASGITQEVRGMIDMSLFDDGVFLGTVLTLVFWWGFGFYIYFRRGYFVGGG